MNRTLPYILLLGIVCIHVQLMSQIPASSNLPLIVIDSKGNNIVDEPKVKADMTIYWNPEETEQKISPEFIHYRGNIGIEIRGQSSQSFPKKSFGIETRDTEDEGMDVALLGMPQEEDWVIHSPFSDKSLMRNALAYTLAAQMFPYAPRVKFCELVLNNEYYGVVLFTERIKRDKFRVDINNLKPDENEGDDLTGGYIIKFDKFSAEELGWVSPYKPIPANNAETRFILEDPKPEDITATQRNYIRSFVTDFENALMSDRWREEGHSYKDFIDVKSFVHMTLITEIAKNVDGYRLSTFMYKDKDSNGGLLTMGPVWDFNLAFGNADYCKGGEPTGWEYDFNQQCPNDYWVNHVWWKRLLEDPEYVALLKTEYQTLRQGEFSDTRMIERIDSMTTVLQTAQTRNFTKWPVLNNYVWPNRYVGNTYANEINYLKNWLTERLRWLDDNIAKLTTSGDETILEESVLLYPNPVSQLLNIQVGSATDIFENMEIYNSNGQLINSTPYNPILDVSSLIGGLYYVRLKAKNRQTKLVSFTKIDD